MTESAEYSLDNGMTITTFDKGEFYGVPPHVAEGLIKRGWARRVTDDDEVPTDEEKDLPAMPLKAKKGK